MSAATLPRPATAKKSKFVAVKKAIMQGRECVAVARSHTFAKRIANALEHYQAGSRGC